MIGHDGHGHLWSLPDGTGLHAPIGRLLRDGEDRLCCHLCGRWFAALGPHLRVHGHTAVSYREAMGLGSTSALVSHTVSARTSNQRGAAYHCDPDVRQRFAPGHTMARDGSLNQRARETLARDGEPAERVRVRRAALDAGRATRARRRRDALGRRLGAASATSLADYLRGEYARGASLADFARSTGLGRARLRSAVDDAGITVRPSGVNVTAGRRSKADTAAAARVGATDISTWLVHQHSGDRSISDLARTVARSPAWVRSRLGRAVRDGEPRI